MQIGASKYNIVNVNTIQQSLKTIIDYCALEEFLSTW